MASVFVAREAGSVLYQRRGESVGKLVVSSSSVLLSKNIC